MVSAQRAPPTASTRSSRATLTELLLIIAAGFLGWWLRGRRQKWRTAVIGVQAATPDEDYMRNALRWCLTMSGAARVIVWHVDTAADTLAPISAVGGAQPEAQHATGDPLVWVASERVSIRIQPTPIWSTAPGVYATPINTPSGAFVLTLELTDTANVNPTQFEGLALYIAAVLGVQAQLGLLAEQHARADELIATLRELPSAIDAEALSALLARAGCQIVDGTGAAVSVWEREQGTVIAVEQDGPHAGATFRESESESALAARAGATLLRQPGTFGKLPAVSPGERFKRKPRAMIAVPLKVGHDVIAVLTAWTAGEITRHAVQDLETLAPYAALQLRHAREFGVMRTRAEHDALTGLNNRRAFEEHLGEETARYDRYHHPFTLAIFDIDHFKSVNDRYGHDAGDLILQQVSNVIRTSLRHVDFAARLGGEEFVVLLPETELQKGIDIAERIRTRVSELSPNWRGQEIPVRISAGVSAVPEIVKDPAMLVRSADQALYQSKHAGRNRVTAATPMHR